MRTYLLQEEAYCVTEIVVLLGLGFWQSILPIKNLNPHAQSKNLFRALEYHLAFLGSRTNGSLVLHEIFLFKSFFNLARSPFIYQLPLCNNLYHCVLVYSKMQNSFSYSYSSSSTFIIKTQREFESIQLSSEEEESEEEYNTGKFSLCLFIKTPRVNQFYLFSLLLLGGYHKISIGDTFKDSYVIKSKLGWGHFSTVWLAENKIAHGILISFFFYLSILVCLPLHSFQLSLI